MNWLVVNRLTEAQIGELHSLYQSEWWSAGRSLAEVRSVLEHSDLLFGIITPDSPRLLAFARVLTDCVFKALLFDVIVHPEHRSAGLGSFLMNHILAHPVLSRVHHVELYCRSERTAFYERHGFTAVPGELQFMRKENARV